MDTINTTDSTTLLIVNMTNVTKLTATNYLMWSRQVYALLGGYNLAGYVDGTKLIPAEIITQANTVIPNPAHDLWKRQDKLVYSALLGSISVSVQPVVSTATTSAQIWNKLASTYAKPSRRHIKQLKHHVKNWTKGTKTVDAYIQGFTTKFDELALLGKPIDHEDQIDYILGTTRRIQTRG